MVKTLSGCGGTGLAGIGQLADVAGLFAAVEHVFLTAPPLLLPLGLILLRTPLLPRPFALLAVVLGAPGPVLGVARLFTVTTNNNGPTGAAINALLAA